MSDYVRFTDVLNNYWDGLEKSDGVPKESIIEPDALEGIWNDCYFVNVARGEPYRYDYLGKNLIEAYGQDISKAEVESLVYPAVEKIAAMYGEVIKSRKPTDDNGEFINSNKMLVKYRQKLLPFGDDSGNVTHILGGMRWRSF